MCGGFISFMSFKCWQTHAMRWKERQQTTQNSVCIGCFSGFFRKSSDDSWHIKMFKKIIPSGYHKNLPLWALEVNCDYFCIYFMYLAKYLIGVCRLGVCIFMTAVTKAVPCLFSLCSCSLHAIILLWLSTHTHKQTNKQTVLPAASQTTTSCPDGNWQRTKAALP